MPAGADSNPSQQQMPASGSEGFSLRQSLLKARQLLSRHRRRMRLCQGAAHAAVLPGKVSHRQSEGLNVRAGTWLVVLCYACVCVTLHGLSLGQSLAKLIQLSRA